MFDELKSLEDILENAPKGVRIKTLSEVEHKNLKFPIHSVSIGSTNPKAPTFGIFGGVHGLEKIGSRAVISYLSTLFNFMQWDQGLKTALKHFRIISIPIVNPSGFYLNSRSNANGVDLMRNAPIEGVDINPLAIYAGHRLSNKLPWYRGPLESPMQKESNALYQFVKNECFDSKFTITLDVHSGFGMHDQIWFPYAYKKQAFPDLGKVYELKRLLDKSYPFHFYIYEPQAKSYCTHGDLWDFMYEKHQERKSKQTFLPLCLEMGSWRWIKKNPIQMFKSFGMFNPIKQHRRERVLRRHLPLFDFFSRAVMNTKSWLPKDLSNATEEAKKLWYPND